MSDSRWPLVGRDRELQQVAVFLARVGDGKGGVILLEGEAGIGKTALCDHIVDLATDRGGSIFRAAAEELEAELPFSVIARALLPGRARSADSSGHQVRDALVELGVAGGEEETLRYRAVEAILDFVQGLVSAQPVVIAVDDLQWADPSTLVVLSELRRLVHDLPLVLVLAARPTPRIDALRALMGRVTEDGALHLPLSPLRPGDVEALASTLTGGPSGPDLLSQLARAGGNPLYVVELIAGLQTSDANAPSDGSVDAASTRPPDTLRQLMLRRVSSLGRPTFELVRQAAVFGDSFSVAECESLAGNDSSPVLGRLQEALDAGVLAPAGDRLSFRHDLVREALYLDIPQPIRKSLHRRAATAMTASGRVPAEVAPHLIAGAERGDDVAIDTLQRAAGQLRWRDPGIAARLFGAAGALCRADDPRRPSLVAAEVEGLLWSGRLPDVVRRAGDALSLWPSGATAAQLRLALVRALNGSSRYPEAAEVVSAGVENSEPARERALLLVEGAIAKLGADDVPGSERLALLAWDCAPGEEARAAAVVMLAVTAWARGDIEHSLALADEGLAGLKAAQSAQLDRTPMLLLVANLLAWGDRLQEAEELARHGLRRAEELAATWLVPMFHSLLGFFLFRRGQWHDAEAEFETGLRFGRDLGHTVMDPVAFTSLALIELSRGDVVAAADKVALAEELLGDSVGLVLAVYAAVAKAEVLLASGRPDESFELAHAVWEKATNMDSLTAAVTVAPVLVLSGAETRRHHHVREVAAAMSDVASRMKTPTARGVSAFAKGVADDAPEEIVRAALEFDAAPRVALAARSREEAGKRFLTSPSGSGNAVLLLKAARSAFEEMGATRDAARVTSFLRTAGVRTGSRTSQRTATTGWDALTPTEVQVAHLVGEGLTNLEVARRLYVSHRTVETHLSRIYRKLGLSSRAALAAALARHVAHPLS